jgi:hypothetical protein
MKLFLLIIFWSALAYSTTPVSKTIDNLKTTGGSTLALPSTGTNLATDTNTLTFTGKTISGSNNTLSQLPVESQMQQDIFYGNSTTTSFTLSFSQVSVSGLLCYLDGMALVQGSSNDYTASGTTLSLNVAPATGQRILCIYSKY